jgi:Zn-finger nucleic acid-binding protein
MLCPRCRSDLETNSIAGVALHSCARCGGIMMDRKNFEHAAEALDVGAELIDHARAIHQKAQAEIDLRMVVYLACPVCSKSMARKNFGRVSGAMVDVCIEHGTWFDQGELAKSLEFVRDGGGERTQRFEEAEAEHEREQRKVIEEIKRKTPKFRGGWW